MSLDRETEKDIKEIRLKPSPKGFIRKYIACLLPAIILVPLYVILSPYPGFVMASVLWPLLLLGAVVWVLRSKEASAVTLLTIFFMIAYGAYRVYQLAITSNWNWVEIGHITNRYEFIHEIFQATIAFSVIIGIIAIIFTELYRRSITYTITENGVTFEGGMIKKTFRNIPFHMIGQVILEQSLLGRLLNYGTIILVSPAAWGEEYYARALGFGGGRGGIGAGIGYSRILQEISRDPLKVMYAVPDPMPIVNLIEKNISIPFQHYKKGLEFFTKNT